MYIIYVRRASLDVGSVGNIRQGMETLENPG